ncbi:unnamed protein product [Prorocentrum cordatum]|uniref:Uncharacterized protein n=1 Tax=Prorocentrum cordatum TaxID=2364126 RepID=A0ABN9YE74_9DINO|nr:unnamed protein product [Polarella glacialis]
MVSACQIVQAIIKVYVPCCLIGAFLLQDQPLTALLAPRGPLALFSVGPASRLDAAAPLVGQTAAVASPAPGLAPRTRPTPTLTPKPTPGPPAAGEGHGPAGGGAEEDEPPLPAVLEHGWFRDSRCTKLAIPWRGAPSNIDVWRPNGSCLHTDGSKESYQFVCSASLGLVFVQKMDRDCNRLKQQNAIAPEMWQRIKRGECIFYGTAEMGNDVYSQLNTTLPASYGVGCAAFPPPPAAFYRGQGRRRLPSRLGRARGRRRAQARAEPPPPVEVQRPLRLRAGSAVQLLH